MKENDALLPLHAAIVEIAAAVFFPSSSEAVRAQCCTLVSAKTVSKSYEAGYRIWRLLEQDGTRQTSDFCEEFRRFITGMWYGSVHWFGGQNPDLLAVSPAQELDLQIQAGEHRDWRQQWTAFGVPLYDSRMIALKTDSVWEELSAFGLPWPPFEVGSWVSVEDVFFREARSLGLLTTPLKPPARVWEFNPVVFRRGLEVSLQEYACAEELKCQ